MAYTAIDDPEAYFQVKTYTGNESDDHSITLDGDENMQPDLVWIKHRNGGNGHHMYDSIRGVTERIRSDTSAAEATQADGLTDFDSDGFTLDDGNGVNGAYTYVAWCWKASGSTASNSNGTNITSTVDANTTAGFSIVSYTGSGTTSDTVGHGLSSLDLLIVKSRDETDSWFVKHKDLASSKNLNLDQTVAETDVTSAYSEGGLSNLSGNTFGFLDGTSDANAVNESSEAHIAYCFKSVQGYSKFGKYSTNNNADGPYIFTGFSPAFVMLKVFSGNTGGWDIWDNKRGFNPNEEVLQANAASAEASNDAIDLLSNGFKIRNTSGNVNGSGDTIVYMAFAEAPFVNSNGVPCNAR
jgi:hypothetical protein